VPLHPIQRGELTDRLRRFFGINGPYQGQLESVSSPVVIAQDISQAPYRQEGLRWFSYRQLQPAAGQVAVYDVSGATVFTVDQVTIYNNTGNPNRYQIMLQPGSSGGAANDGVVPELANDPTIPYVGSVTTFATTPVPPAPTIFDELYALGLGATSGLILPTEIVVKPGFRLRIMSEVTAASAHYSINGRFFTQVA
jgi:hypothetical protein